MNADDVLAVVVKLARYAYARDRSIDREPRTITITDDEAALLLDLLDAKSPTYPPSDGRRLPLREVEPDRWDISDRD